MERNQDDDVQDGGYVRGGVGGGSTFGITSVDGSSFLIDNLFTLNPVPQYSSGCTVTDNQSLFIFQTSFPDGSSNPD